MYIAVIRNDWAWVDDSYNGAELVCESKDELLTLLDIALNSRAIISIRTYQDVKEHEL